MKLKKLLLAALIAVSAIAFVACGDKKDEAAGKTEAEVKKETPTKAVEKFCNAIAAKDANKLAERLYLGPAVKESIEAADKSESEFIKEVFIDKVSDENAAKFKDVKVVKEEINGDSATVTVKDPDGKEGEIECIKDDGTWKVKF